MFTRRWESIGYWLLAMALLLIGVFITRAYILDDALITLRYSYNWGQNGDPIWNQADITNPTIGYTTFLWMAINTIPALFTEDRAFLIAFSKWFSLIPLGVIVYLHTQYLAKTALNAVSKFLIVVLLFAQATYGLHLNSGMETLIYSCFVLLAVKTYVDANNRWLPYILGLVAFLIRPEGVIVLALVGLFDFFQGRYKRAVGWGVVSVAVLALLLFWVYSNYNTFLPNPYYVKQTRGDMFSRIFESGKHTLFFMVTLAWPFFLLSLYGAFKLKDRLAKYMLGVAFVYLLYYLTVYPGMNIMSRYQWPIYVLLSFGSLPGLVALAKQSEANRLRSAFAVFGVFMMLLNIGNSLGAQYYAWSVGNVMENLNELADAMAPHREDNQWLVYHDAGMVCYVSDWNCFDTIGLNNREIATKEMTIAEVYQQPTAEVVMRSIDYTDPARVDRIKAHETRMLAAGYERVDSYPLFVEEGNRDFGVIVWARDPEKTAEIFDSAELNPNHPPHPISNLFLTVRKLVKDK